MTLRNAFEDLATEATLAALEAKTPALQSGRVPVDIGSATVSIGASVEVSNDAGNPLPISDAGGSITVDAASLPLPTGAATAANQATIIGHVDGIEALATAGNASLASIDGKTPALQSGGVPVTDNGGSLTIDAASLPLPTGAATAANQATLIGHVDGLESGLGAQADAAASSDTGTFSLLALVKRGLQNWTTLLARVPSLTVSSTRLLVDGSGVTQPASVASLPLPSGAATAANQSTLIGHVDGIEGLLTTIDADTGNIDAKLPVLASGRIPVDGSGVTQPVSAAALPLPSGAATATNQSTANSSLSSIDGKLAALQSGAMPVGDNGGSLTVDGRSGSPAVTFTRPADTTPYGAADVIGSASTANHEATNAGANGSLIQIISASLMVNLTSVPSGMTTFRLHIWDSQPTAIADNAVFSAAAADRAKYAGWIDLAQISAVGGGFLFTFGDYVGRPIRLSGTSFWFNLAMTGTAGHTPASGTEYRVRFHCAEVGS